MDYAPRGEIRRSPDGAQVVVCVSAHPSERSDKEDPHRRWRLVTAEVDPYGYGWRSDPQVAGWVRVGNALTLSSSFLCPDLTEAEETNVTCIYGACNGRNCLDCEEASDRSAKTPSAETTALALPTARHVTPPRGERHRGTVER